MGKDDKTHINVVVIGHVDSGKSTTVRLLRTALPGAATPSKTSSLTSI